MITTHNKYILHPAQNTSPKPISEHSFFYYCYYCTQNKIRPGM